jgi:hypothetical protein
MRKTKTVIFFISFNYKISVLQGYCKQIAPWHVNEATLFKCLRGYWKPSNKKLSRGAGNFFKIVTGFGRYWQPSKKFLWGHWKLQFANNKYFSGFCQYPLNISQRELNTLSSSYQSARDNLQTLFSIGLHINQLKGNFRSNTFEET